MLKKEGHRSAFGDCPRAYSSKKPSFWGTAIPTRDKCNMAHPGQPDRQGQSREVEWNCLEAKVELDEMRQYHSG